MLLQCVISRVNVGSATRQHYSLWVRSAKMLMLTCIFHSVLCSKLKLSNFKDEFKDEFMFYLISFFRSSLYKWHFITMLSWDVFYKHTTLTKEVSEAENIIVSAAETMFGTRPRSQQCNKINKITIVATVTMVQNTRCMCKKTFCQRFWLKVYEVEMILFSKLYFWSFSHFQHYVAEVILSLCQFGVAHVSPANIQHHCSHQCWQLPLEAAHRTPSRNLLDAQLSSSARHQPSFRLLFFNTSTRWIRPFSLRQCLFYHCLCKASV